MAMSSWLLLVAVGFHAAIAYRRTFSRQISESAAPDGVTQSQEEPRRPSPLNAPLPREIRFLFIRHALSCANAVQTFSEPGKLWPFRWGGTLGKAFLRDPMLTECGAVRSKWAGDQLQADVRTPDFVLSSSMLRAIETAAFMFPGKTITPVPFISESRHIDLERDNLPLGVAEQTAQMLKVLAARNITGMRHEHLAQLSENLNMKWMSDDRYEKGRMSSSWDHFLEFMSETFLPSLTLPPSQEWPLTIAVVSHSNFLKSVPIINKYCKKAQGLYASKPENNQVLELRYNYAKQVAVGPELYLNVDPFGSFTGILSSYKSAVSQKKDSDVFYTVDEMHFNHITRSLKGVEDQKCRNHVTVPPAPAGLCPADVGKVCEMELEKAFPSQGSRPKLAYRQQSDDCCVGGANSIAWSWVNGPGSGLKSMGPKSSSPGPQ